MQAFVSVKLLTLASVQTGLICILYLLLEFVSMFSLNCQLWLDPALTLIWFNLWASAISAKQKKHKTNSLHNTVREEGNWLTDPTLYKWDWIPVSALIWASSSFGAVHPPHVYLPILLEVSHLSLPICHILNRCSLGDVFPFHCKTYKTHLNFLSEREAIFYNRKQKVLLLCVQTTWHSSATQLNNWLDQYKLYDFNDVYI